MQSSPKGGAVLKRLGTPVIEYVNFIFYVVAATAPFGS